MKTHWNDHAMFNFCTNMAMVLEGGLSIQEGLEVIQGNCDQNKTDIDRILNKVEESGSLSIALKDETCIDDYAKKMIDIGEMSGKLESVMKELAGYFERSYDLKQSLKEALVYPFLLLVMMWCIILIIIWQVLPIFNSILHRIGTILPGNALTMMNFGNLFGLASFIILSVLLIVCIILYFANRNVKGNILAYLPFTKKFYYHLTMAKMTFALSLFIASGYDIQEALLYLGKVIDHAETEKKLNNCKERMIQGENFADAIAAEKIYVGIYANMIDTGFRSGKHDEVLKKASQLFEKDVDKSISGFLNIIEPSVVVLLSIIVGVILLSVMLPLMSIISSI